MSSLSSLCTVSNVATALPLNGTILGVNLLPSTVTANVANSSSSTGGGMPKRDDTSSTYCNVTVQYNHPGKNDNIVLWYTFPAPSDFQNRFYVAGGGGYSEGSSDPTGGLEYGAVSGSTDSGYDGFTKTLDEVVLTGNGSIAWDDVIMFAYQAQGEMAIVGKELSRGFYGLDDENKVYTYFEGCSDGGREAMSQVQRYGDVYDGVVAGAPAFHHAQQQTNHLVSSVTEVAMGYYAPPCEMEKIANLTIQACDSLDGRTDGVVSRTDLCLLTFNLTTLVGEPYYCAAATSSSLGFGFSKRQAGASVTSSTPEQSGTVSAGAVALAQKLYSGLHNSKGEQVYLPWQIASSFEDAKTTYNNATGSWEVNIPSTGGVFVTKFVELVDLDNLSSLDDVTYDDLYQWMFEGYLRYHDSLQTGYQDLTPFRENGGKLIHYHGESDPSIPPSSSVRYHEAVRSAMYPGATFNQSVSALSDWYQLYLVPGAAHCGTNTLQPGPYPAANMQTLIDWVEGGVRPARLSATVSSGGYEGETQMLCQWPARPIWSGNSSFSCAFDQASYDSWQYDLDAWKIPVY
ncbi:hypothetical protein VPNG_08435 [Cytospora leucostoma]|uniref:Carboxylic ester hydrolase n=1 Tax=Cytospora leucostoma TaxID=1230097 RepID=A0A423W605_9PEZI|nr:hypothetical protein VPNG_08435 [Cytospora leucostoma]